jgi:UDP-GlcNAc3NAcA epimerase
LAKLAKDEVVVFPVHPRTKKYIAKYGFNHTPHFLCVDPVGYLDMVALVKNARMVLTDSGGLQKEAYWLKVPCVTLRDETEWVETVESGWNVLTGSSFVKVVNAVRGFTIPRKHPDFYGKGNAARKCVELISKIVK